MESITQITDRKQSVLFQFVIPVFYLLIFLKNYVGEQNKTLQTILTSCYILIGVGFTFFFFFKLKSNSIILILISFLCLLSLLISIFSENYRIEDNILTFMYFGIALLPVNVKLNYKIYKIFAYIIIVFFILQVINGSDPNDIFDVSRNFISVLLLIGLSYHIISSYQNEKVPNLLLFILSLAISIWATGRGGIIAFSFLLISYPFCVKIKLHNKLLILFFITVIGVLAYIYLYSFLFEFGFGRFDNMGLEGDRTLMNADYFAKSLSTIKNFLIGSPLNEIPSIMEVENNPHNSFIRMHVYYGLFGFILLIYMQIYSIFKFLKTKNTIFLVLLIALLLRSFLDSIAFHGPLDPIIYFLIFSTIKEYNIVN